MALRKLGFYHEVIRKLRNDRHWGSMRIHEYLLAGKVECHRSAVSLYVSKWSPGQMPSAAELGIEEYQVELRGVKIVRVRKEKEAKVVVPRVYKEVKATEVLPQEVPKVLVPTVPAASKIVKDINEVKEPYWGFASWETWVRSGVAENREYLFSLRPCDKVSAPGDWKDGVLGITGFIGDKAWGELADDWEGAYWKNKAITDWNRAQLLYVLEIFFEIEPQVGGDGEWYGVVKDRVSGGDMGQDKEEIRYGLAVYFMELSNRFIPRARHMGLDTVDPKKRRKR